eukprot:210689_1
MESTTFTSPSIPDTNTLSILCISCGLVTFHLGGVQNAVLSDASGMRLWESNIHGPSGYFELNIMHWGRFNKYFLQNTATIMARSFGVDTKVYLGNALDVNIQCPLQSEGSLYWKCGNTNIWSTLQRNEIRLGTTQGYWDLDTSYELLIHFDFEPYPCTYLEYVSNCSFMTFTPTNHPSYQPSHQTGNPSSIPSDHPSSEPFQFPTNNPSQTPSQQTRNPTNIPTHTPSQHPTRILTISMYHGNTTIDPVDYTTPRASPVPTEFLRYIIIAVAILVILGYFSIRHGIKKNKQFKVKQNEERQETIVKQQLRESNADHVPNIVEVAMKEPCWMDRMSSLDSLYIQPIGGNTKTTTKSTTDSLNIKRRIHNATKMSTQTDKTSERDDNDQVEGLQLNNDNQKGIAMEYTIEGPGSLVNKTKATYDTDICGRCIDCGKEDAGKIYSGDGMFYCNQCWISYS